MAEGRSRWQRSMLVAQATLVWADEKVDVQEFVATGSFNESSDVIPYESSMRDVVVAQWQNG